MSEPRELAGIMTERRSLIEAMGAPVMPGTLWVPCAECGLEVAIGPATRPCYEAGLRALCRPCVMRLHPEGIDGWMSREGVEESATLDRLDRQSTGPVS